MQFKEVVYIEDIVGFYREHWLQYSYISLLCFLPGLYTILILRIHLEQRVQCTIQRYIFVCRSVVTVENVKLFVFRYRENVYCVFSTDRYCRRFFAWGIVCLSCCVLTNMVKIFSARIGSRKMYWQYVHYISAKHIQHIHLLMRSLSTKVLAFSEGFLLFYVKCCFVFYYVPCLLQQSYVVSIYRKTICEWPSNQIQWRFFLYIFSDNFQIYYKNKSLWT